MNNIIVAKDNMNTNIIVAKDNIINIKNNRNVVQLNIF